VTDRAGDSETAPSDPFEVDVRVLRDLRRQRRRRRLADIEWFEAAYRVYLVGFLGVVAVLTLSSAIGDEPATASQLAWVREYGAAAVGVVAAIAAALGLRSGSRGGPLALEAAEVRYVLLAPVPRRGALLSPAGHQLRYLLFVGLAAGAAGGQLASLRLPGTLLPWAASCAAAGALVAALFAGCGYLAAGSRLRRPLATLLGAALVAWAVLDLAELVPAPSTAIGGVALWPLRFYAVEVLAFPAVAVVVLAGLRQLGGVSLEAAERRTELVGQLRFAVTLQDLRTVILLRRQLAQERPRTSPWWKLRRAGHHAMWRRDWRGYLRFPATRLARMLVLTVVAAASLVVAYHDARVAVVAAALAVYLVGLDAIEPLAQEVDQADWADSAPVERGVLLARHLPAAAVATALIAAIGAVTALAIEHTALAAAVIAIAAPCAALGGAAGAVVTIVSGMPESTSSTTNQEILPPEVAGMRVVVRAVWPLVLAAVGTTPVVAARAAADAERPVVAGALQGAMATALVVGLVVAWVRYREPARAWWRRTLEASQEANKPA
jgi:hypothetical protein